MSSMIWSYAQEHWDWHFWKLRTTWNRHWLELNTNAFLLERSHSGSITESERQKEKDRKETEGREKGERKESGERRKEKARREWREKGARKEREKINKGERGGGKKREMREKAIKLI